MSERRSITLVALDVGGLRTRGVSRDRPIGTAESANAVRHHWRSNTFATWSTDYASRLRAVRARLLMDK